MKLSCAEVLSQKEISKIDQTSREILEETGVKVYSRQVLDIFKKGGADVDYDKMTAKIPEKC